MVLRLCKFKTNFFFALVLLLLVVLEPSSLLTQEKDSVTVPEKKDELKTIIVASYFPYTYVNKDGAPDGFSVDLAKAVSQVMGMGLNVQVGTWARARAALENGKINSVNDLTGNKIIVMKNDQAHDYLLLKILILQVLQNRLLLSRTITDHSALQ